MVGQASDDDVRSHPTGTIVPASPDFFRVRRTKSSRLWVVGVPNNVRRFVRTLVASPAYAGIPSPWMVRLPKLPSTMGGAVLRDFPGLSTGPDRSEVLLTVAGFLFGCSHRTRRRISASLRSNGREVGGGRSAPTGLDDNASIA